MNDGFVNRKYEEFYDKNGYIPNMFNPYNCSEINDFAPTITTQCGSTTSSATVLIKEEYMNKLMQIGYIDKNAQGQRIYDLELSPTLKSNGGGISGTSGLHIMGNNKLMNKGVDGMWNNNLEKFNFEMEEIKLISLFSGIGAFEKALNQLGVKNKIINFAEVDIDAIISYGAIHIPNFENIEFEYDTEDNMRSWLIERNIGFDFAKEKSKIPKLKKDKLYKLYKACVLGNNLGDVSLIKYNNKDIDLIVGGSPCFTEETLVLTNDGFKKIKDIKIGDYVLDHTNQYNKVTNYIEQGQKEIWNIKAMCFDELNTTSNHKFYVREKYKVWDNEKRVYKRSFNEPQWVETKDLNKDFYLGVAINQESKLPKWDGVECKIGKNTYIKNNLNIKDHRFWYFCGRFLGDGWVRRRRERNNNISGVIICCAKYECEDFENKIGDLFKYNKIEDRTTFKYQFSNKELGMFLSQFGHGAKNKFIPNFVFDLPVEYLKSFLEGYFDSDGSYKNGEYKATSISRELIFGIGQCIAKVYKRPFSIYKTIRPKTHVIENRIVNQNDTYQIKFKVTTDKQDKAFYDNGYIWCPIKSITNTREYKETYDITVDNSHSFTANGCIVHNCQDFSVAGKMQGSIWFCRDCGHEYNPLEQHYEKRDCCPKCESENLDKTRSSLLVEYLRAVREIKPKYFVYENVKNIKGKNFISMFNLFEKELEEYGYNTYNEIVNSKNYGIPQNRERVFVVGIRKDIVNKFNFNKGFNNDIKLKDVLESVVDEKYYINTDRAVTLIDKLRENRQLNSERVPCDSTIMKPKALDVANCITARYDAGIQNKQSIGVAVAERIGGLFDDKIKHQADSVWNIEGLSPTLDTMQGGYREPCIVENEPKLDITSVDYRIRKLTPLECWRLQGFYDNDLILARNQGISDSQLYKQAGNSITTNVLYYIFKNLFKEYIK